MFRSSPRRKARTAAALAAGMLTQALVPNPAHAAPRRVSQRPLDRQILVVAANVEEVWNDRDNADSDDLRTFVRRLLRQAPHSPDVLLLQEVSRRSTRKLVNILERKTSQGYGIAVSAGKNPVKVKDGRAYTRETSILFNSRRMKAIGEGRLINTSHRRPHGNPWRLPEVKRNAAALLRERGTGITFPVASVHFHTKSQLRNKKLARRYRTIWSRRMVDVMRREWPFYRSRIVVGGDFNGTRSRWRAGRKVVQNWWKVMARRGFRDSVHAVRSRGGVDHIFTRTRIAAADLDSSYHPDEVRGTSAYYSDHRFRWALLGQWRPRVRGKVASSTTIDLSWKALPSAKKIWVKRSRPGSGRWRIVASLRGSSSDVSDRRLEPATPYLYRVVANNGAETSAQSRTVRLRTRRDRLPPKQPPPPKIGLKVKPLNDKQGLSPKPVGIRLTWPRTPDRGGSGIGGYEVWRAELGRDAKLITKTRRKRYVDKNFTKRKTIEYFIVAYDKVGNRSRRSDAATALPS